ncbi:MAG: histone deacetylase [Flavobacteriales bacterium]|nr:histone deacetylase [Flavobacteriales bacterium]|tara:strand:- start:8766 stop:9665 length:900 start_codon:yes stop_codon:yes gene_type:complete
MYKVAFHPIYVHPVPENHRFPMEKYELLPQQLIHEGVIEHQQLFEPTQIQKYDFSIHKKDYLQRLYNLQLTRKEERASGFIQSKQLIDREICITNGTIEASVFALKDQVAFNIAGGTHHAFSDRPEGFCLLNDQAIAATHLIKNVLAKKILIVDLDVHQGNGTAEILSNNTSVFTFSMHGQKNYPNHKPASNLDIGLEDFTSDDQYLSILEQQLNNINQLFHPDYIFYQAGVDVLSSDKLGRLNLSIIGTKQRDTLVFNFAKQLNAPVMVTMGGGYSTDIKQILNAHCNTFKTANEIFI